MIADAGDNIDVRLPRFKIAFSTDMRSPLTHQGMGIAFTSAADFKPMGFPHECIASVIHKAVLEVDESGSEAAAATAVIMRTTAAFGAPHVTPVIVFDRPFLCAIVDDTTGAILFEGIVRDPK
jgi:serpin B